MERNTSMGWPLTLPLRRSPPDLVYTPIDVTSRRFAVRFRGALEAVRQWVVCAAVGAIQCLSPLTPRAGRRSRCTR